MIIKYIKNHKYIIPAVFMMLLFYIGIAGMIPYTHDDWEWGTETGLTHLFTADINSRFCGNLIEVILTRNEIIKTVFMALVFVLIPLSITIFASRISGINNNSNKDLVHTVIFLFANLIILLIPADVWAQTNGWVAGFSNFVVSGGALAIFFYILAVSTSSDKTRKSWLINSILCFIYGVMIQLFIENLTVFYFIFAVVFLIAGWKKANKKTLIPLCSGLLAGAVLMFSNNIYLSLLKTGYAVDEYRQLMYDPNQPFYVFIADSVKCFFDVMLPLMILHHGVLAGLIAVLMAVPTYKNTKNKLLGLCLTIINGALCLYYVATYVAGVITGRQSIENSFLSSTIDFIFVLLIFIEIFLAYRDRKRLFSWLMILWLSPFLVIAPMLMVNTVGPRSFFTVYICLILFGATVLGVLLSGAGKKAAGIILSLTAALTLVICVRWIVIYKAISVETRTRKMQIETAVANGDKYIHFDRFPYDEYLWFPDPKDPERIVWFKDFYGIPEDTVIVFKKWEDQGGLPDIQE